MSGITSAVYKPLASIVFTTTPARIARSINSQLAGDTVSAKTNPGETNTSTRCPAMSVNRLTIESKD